MDRNRQTKMTGGGPKGMWRYMDGNDTLSDMPMRMDKRSAAPQGNCDEKSPLVVITPFLEK